MKKSIFIIALITGVLYNPTMHLKCQSNAPTKKVELIVQLAMFIDWSQNTKFSDSKQTLYVISSNKLAIDCEMRSARNAFYKNWKIICSEKINDVENGSVVFITNEKKGYTKEVIKLSAHKDILTIAEDQQGFCGEGGMINIFSENDQQKFEINYKIIQEKSLNISSKVLALAKIYNE